MPICEGDLVRVRRIDGPAESHRYIGHVGLVERLDFPNANKSHVFSRDYWHLSILGVPEGAGHIGHGDVERIAVAGHSADRDLDAGRHGGYAGLANQGRSQEPKEFQSKRDLAVDRDLCLKLLRKGVIHLNWVDASLSGDRDIVFAALQGNAELALAALQVNALQWADESLRGHRPVTLSDVKCNGVSLQWTSFTWSTQQEIWKAAIHGNRQLFYHAPKALQDDPEVCREYWEGRIRDSAGKDFARVPAALRGDRGLVELAVDTCPSVFALALEPATSNLQTCLVAVQKHGGNLQHCSAAMRGSKEVVIAAVNSSPEALKFAGSASDGSNLSQDPECWQAAGLWGSREEIYEMLQKAILSVKFGLAEKASSYSTEVALRVRKNTYLSGFEFYNPNAFCKASCDPQFTNIQHPCRGTTDTCGMQLALRSGETSLESCWRYSFRQHQKACRLSGGFMVQVQEVGGLGQGQEIETEMATLEGLKVFRLVQTTAKRGFSHKDAQMLADAVEAWIDVSSQDMTITEIVLPK